MGHHQEYKIIYNSTRLIANRRHELKLQRRTAMIRRCSYGYLTDCFRSSFIPSRHSAELELAAGFPSRSCEDIARTSTGRDEVFEVQKYRRHSLPR